MLVALVLFGCSHNLQDCTEVTSQDLFFKTTSACEASILEQSNVAVNAPVSLSYCVAVENLETDTLAKLTWQLTDAGPVLKNT